MDIGSRRIWHARWSCATTLSAQAADLQRRTRPSQPRHAVPTVTHTPQRAASLLAIPVVEWPGPLPPTTEALDDARTLWNNYATKAWINTTLALPGAKVKGEDVFGNHNQAFDGSTTVDGERGLVFCPLPSLIADEEATKRCLGAVQ